MNSIEQAQVFVVFLLTGCMIGILFDCFRVARKIVKTSDFMTALEDGVFWILTGLLLVYMIFIFHHGEIRLYLILGALVGLILYFRWISRVFIKQSVKIIQGLIRYIFRPIGKILGFAFNPFKTFFCFVKKKVILCWIKIKEHQKKGNRLTKRSKFTIFSKNSTKKEGIS